MPGTEVQGLDKKECCKKKRKLIVQGCVFDFSKINLEAVIEFAEKSQRFKSREARDGDSQLIITQNTTRPVW